MEKEWRETETGGRGEGKGGGGSSVREMYSSFYGEEKAF